MPLLVMKFGGTSLATIELIKKAAERVKVEVSRGYEVIVIVSAMSGKTNELLDQSKLISKAFNDWRIAKEKNDFKLFQDSLEKLVEIRKEECELIGYTKNIQIQNDKLNV